MGIGAWNGAKQTRRETTHVVRVGVAVDHVYSFRDVAVQDLLQSIGNACTAPIVLHCPCRFWKINNDDNFVASGENRKIRAVMIRIKSRAQLGEVVTLFAEPGREYICGHREWHT
jgi:hypothetical protein